jgi:uncharacterized protein YdeI (BOF family)
MKNLFLAPARFLLTAAIATSASFSLPTIAQAQSVEEPSAATESAQPRFTSPTAPAVTQTVPANSTISRDQAPLPLGTVLETPIERFEPAFADVSTDHWAYAAVTRLFYSGIVSGYAAE